MADCLFCQIVKGEIPTERVQETDQVLAFRDIEPQAPVHLLVIPKQHVASLAALGDDSALLNELVTTARRLGDTESGGNGYRLVINSGSQADVGHLHLHLLGGVARLGALAQPEGTREGGDQTV